MTPCIRWWFDDRSTPLFHNVKFKQFNVEVSFENNLKFAVYESPRVCQWDKYSMNF